MSTIEGVFKKMSMTSVNRVQIIGYLTEKPELRSLSSGVAVCDANIRVNSSITRENGEKMPSTSFHTITLWRWNAENLVKYADTGSQIYIAGRLKTESWDDDSGKKRYKTKVIADEMTFLTPKDGAFPALAGDIAFESGLNKAEVLGNLTKDSELKQTPNGNYVSTFSIATNRRWKDRNTNEDKEEVEYHNIVLWGEIAKQGEEHLKRGRKVFIEGRVQTRSWETPDGEKRYTTEIVAEKILLLGHESPDIEASDITISPENSYKQSTTTNTQNFDELPEIPTIKYESDIKPEDLPF